MAWNDKYNQNDKHNHSDFCCPNCGSENVQSLPIIFKSGSSGSSEIIRTTNFIGVTKGTMMTDLAKSVAPPQPKEADSTVSSVFGALAIFSFIAGVISAAICFFIVAVICYVPVMNAEEYNKKQLPIDYDNWQNSFLCHRCGTVFRR